MQSTPPSPPKAAPTFRDIGIECQQPPAVQKSLTYENPISLSVGNVFTGDCSLGAFTYFNGPGNFSETSIGRYCSIADAVLTGLGQHATEAFSTHPFIQDPEGMVSRLGGFPAYKAIAGKNAATFLKTGHRVHASPRVTIGHDVWIGTRAIILNGVTVGHGAVIAAGAIVTRDVEPYTIVAGVPARPIRTRFEPARIAELLELGWWDYDMSAVSNRVDYGDVSGVIAFLRGLIERNEVRRFAPELWKLEAVNGTAKITKLRREGDA